MPTVNKDRTLLKKNIIEDPTPALVQENPPHSQRDFFLTQLKYAIERLENDQRFFVLLLIKIDNFSDVEQGFGFELSKQLMITIDNQLQSLSSASDCLVSLQGDEFALLKTDITSASDAITLAEKIQDRFRFSFRVNNYNILCSCSLGISLQQQQQQQRPRTVSQILKDADTALKIAQTLGRGQYHLSTATPAPAQNISAIRQQEKLTNAIINDDIHPYYQPIIQLNSNQLIGFEVVARWQEAQHLIHDALSFIPLAERTDIIISLDLHIINQACRQLKKWHNAAIENQQLILTINLSVKHLILDGAIEQLISIIQQQQIPPHALVFEFREQDFMAQNEFVIHSLQKLREVGIQVGLDDFGTGFSSLNAFFKYPIDFVKIDQSFTQRMLMSRKDLSLIRAIRDISHDMGFQVIAEGIENPQQHEKLIELGCEFGQGNYIARPMHPTQVNNLLDL
ncbi:MAG: diguanylate cyclase (GGDEF)-like protein [Moritella sp.]|jgi:diguanylate cyclase (GGDEF)-like protein